MVDELFDLTLGIGQIHNVVERGWTRRGHWPSDDEPHLGYRRKCQAADTVLFDQFCHKAAKRSGSGKRFLC